MNRTAARGRRSAEPPGPGLLLRGAHLREAHLRGVHLRGVHLCGAHLRGAPLRGAPLRGVRHLTRGNPRGAASARRGTAVPVVGLSGAGVNSRPGEEGPGRGVSAWGWVGCVGEVGGVG
ncbi:pentapeptide repeat-containing protein [Microtetraspora sp. NBRC 13810]|uniref:pentapeptide repeat-containing protein n=1 Tax=Microtetraspora sp. NBRC 13810 TaxID=3030990 RepID=UPI0025529322|nr:pentapeptide repeat-containing protein [Microtetraspora sp. NBRC 13810]